MSKPAKSKKKSTRSYGQLISLIAALVILLSISTATTMMLTGAISIYEPGIGKLDTIAEAQQLCDKTIRRDYPDMRSFAVDDRSSRFDERINRYKMFYTVDLYRKGKQQKGIDHYYLNCFVDPVIGRVSVFEMLKAEDYSPKAIRNKGGNTFGM